MTGANLVGLTEVAELLGVSRQRAHQLTRTPIPKFPKPLARLASGPVWTRRDVIAYRKQRTTKAKVSR